MVQHKQFIAYEVELQVSYSICAEIQEEGILQGKAAGGRKNSAAVDTAGKNASRIKEYIKNQLQEDQIADQMSIKEYVDPFTGSVNQKA